MYRCRKYFVWIVQLEEEDSIISGMLDRFDYIIGKLQ